MKWLSNLKVSSKLLSGFSVIILLMGIICLTGYISLGIIKTELDSIFEVRLPSVNFLIQADRDLQQLLVAERSMIFANANSELFESLVAEYQENLDQSKMRWNAYKALASDADELALIQQFESARQEWMPLSKDIVEGRRADTRQGRRKALDLSLGQAKEKFNQMRTVLDRLTEINLDKAEQAHQNATPIYYSAVKTLFGVSGLGLVAALLLVWALGRGIIKPIHGVAAFAGRLRLGDLSQRLKTGKDEIGLMSEALNAVVDEMNSKAGIAMAISKGDLSRHVRKASDQDVLGQSLDTMIQNLNAMVKSLRETAEQVNAGAGQVSDSSQALSQGATQQAASLQEITSSMSQIGAQTKTNAENATQANQIAVTARDDSQIGVQHMEEMVTAMDAINTSSVEIAKIIKTIDDIAFQTNLLALNAAVEAARAGKHGKGFAVVAQEVRNLAARSAKAAQETAALIENAGQKVNAGNEIASKTAQALDQINLGTSKVADLVSEIAAASNEQAQGIAQINQGLSQIDSVTQQNTANAEETSSAAAELSALAAKVKVLLSRFVLQNQAKEDTGPPVDIAEARAPGRENQMDERLQVDAPERWETMPEKIIALDDQEFGKY